MEAFRLVFLYGPYLDVRPGLTSAGAVSQLSGSSCRRMRDSIGHVEEKVSVDTVVVAV